MKLTPYNARIPRLARLAAAVLVLASASLSRALVTDVASYPEPPLPALPPAGGTFVDPTFGTTIIRVTDANTQVGKSCGTTYSYWPSFNRTSTRLWAFCEDGSVGVLFDFDPGTRSVSNARLLFATLPPGGGLSVEDAVWSGVDADVMLVHDATRLWAYDVVSGTYTLLKDFGGLESGLRLFQMSRSIDDDVFAFTKKRASTGAVTGYVVYRRSTDSYLVNVATGQLDEVQVDKSGQHLLVKTGLSGSKAVIEDRVYDLGTGAVTDLTDGVPDFAPGHSDNGAANVIGVDDWNNQLTGRSLATPHAFFTVLPWGNDWTQDQHVSLLGDDERWATVSSHTGGRGPVGGPFHQEVYQVQTDGSQHVRRLAHHRSVYRSYYDSPRANVSRDGRFVAFTSNWGGSGRRDLFVVVAPATGVWGDGITDVGEACDDGNHVDGDGCDSNCTVTACGNGIVTAGEQCDDGNVASGDCCSLACVSTPAGTSCDDADPCTTDDRCDGAGACVGAVGPAPGCLAAGAASLTIRNDSIRSLAWKWAHGAGTTADLGDPLAGGTSYALCIYDQVGAAWAVRLRAYLPAESTCAAPPCWTPRANRLLYKSSSGRPGGVTAAMLKPSSLTLKGRGVYLAVAGLPFAQQSRVTVQLRSSNAACWTTELPAPALRNSGTQFRDRAR